MPVFNDFDFQIALARGRGANFVDILDRRSFATPVFRSYLCELSKRQNYGKTQHFAQFLPAKTSLLSNIDAARATGNFQYSRKLELLNFLWLQHGTLVFSLFELHLLDRNWNTTWFKTGHYNWRHESYAMRLRTGSEHPKAAKLALPSGPPMEIRTSSSSCALLNCC